jgi:hypothetical protein
MVATAGDLVGVALVEISTELLRVRQDLIDDRFAGVSESESDQRYRGDAVQEFTWHMRARARRDSLRKNLSLDMQSTGYGSTLENYSEAWLRICAGCCVELREGLLESRGAFDDLVRRRE